MGGHCWRRGRDHSGFSRNRSIPQTGSTGSRARRTEAARRLRGLLCEHSQGDMTSRDKPDSNGTRGLAGFVRENRKGHCEPLWLSPGDRKNCGTLICEQQMPGPQIQLLTQFLEVHTEGCWSATFWGAALGNGSRGCARDKPPTWPRLAPAAPRRLLT